MMDVIIVDDEPAGRRTLREFCEAEADLRVVGEFGDAGAALGAIRVSPPHLLFLDIQMDPLNGIDLARAIDPAQLPSLVFVTAYDTYALEAFEVCAVDYLLKPFDQERFRKRRPATAAQQFAGATGTQRARRARRKTAPLGGVQRPSACIGCCSGGDAGGRPQLRADPRRQG
jgi:DNA-binding LytR/AlgR family response regulator